MQNWLSNQREDDDGEEEEKDEGEEDHQEKEEICARAQSQNQARRGAQAGSQGQGQGQGEVEGQGESAQADDACEAVRQARAGARAYDIAGAGGDADRAAAGFVSVVELSARVPDALQRECEA
jgi:hypothetical protein